MTSERSSRTPIGSVVQCRRHPVKSMQGHPVDRLDVGTTAVAGDRSWGIVTADGTLVSAKQRAELLMATADDDGIDLPDRRRIEFGDPAMDETLSAWLGVDVTLARPEAGTSLSYRMTFDPPDDSAELVDIPVPDGTFLDVAPVHLLTTATLDGARSAYPDLDWDVRRFRPNLLVHVDAEPFVEDTWAGRDVAVGEHVVLHIDQPTVRCAMPLRAQPGLDREVGLYRAMTDMNEAFPYHFGAYVSVTTPGSLHVGDEVALLD